MARPKKMGLSYFPFDVDFFADKKVKRLKAKFGNDAVVMYMYILCEIYRGGYYIEYDEDFILDVSDELNISENLTRQIIDYLLSRSLFDDTLAKSVKVLTAASVQRRYQEAKKGNKSDIEVERKFWVLKESETLSFIKLYPKINKSEINSSFSEINPKLSKINDTKESKVNKSKVNKNKAYVPDGIEISDEISHSHLKIINYQQIIDSFNSICKSLPKVVIITDERKKAIKSAVNNNYDLTTIFKQVENSDFLTARTGGWNGCNFDWILNPKNIVKIIEGNYDNKKQKPNQNHSYNLEKILEYSKNNIPKF